MIPLKHHPRGAIRLAGQHGHLMSGPHPPQTVLIRPRGGRIHFRREIVREEEDTHEIVGRAVLRQQGQNPESRVVTHPIQINDTARFLPGRAEKREISAGDKRDLLVDNRLRAV